MDKEKLQRIKEEANKLGTSFYKFVDPYIVNINESLGKGSFGEVWTGADIRTSQLVAVKQISSKMMKKDSDKLLSSLKNQIDIMKKTKHDNLVTLYDVRKSANNIYLFLELCNKGSLEDLIKKQSRMSEKDVCEVIRQIANGYKFLYDHGIVHRDLKPANILIKDDFYKIADFGFAKYYEGTKAEECIHQTLVGSPIYMCPQILNGLTYSTKCDVWSVGIILYQLVFGRPPYIVRNLNELISAVNKKDIKFVTPLSNKKLQDLIRRMLMYDEKDRISWKQLFECELLNPKKQELEETLKYSIQMAEKLYKSTLGKSRTINQMYFQEHKVIKKVELNLQQEKKVEEIAQHGPLKIIYTEKKNEEEKEQVIEEKQQDDLFKSIAKKHDTQEKRKAIIKKITSYFLNKRNKAVFINHLALQIYECFEQGQLQMPIQDAEIVLFVLSKYQCGIIYKCYMRLIEGKLLDCKKFSQEDFQLFLESPLKVKVLDNFKSDFKVMKLFLDELIIKVKDYIKVMNEEGGKLIPRIERVSKICNNNLCPKQLMKQIFFENMDLLISSLKKHCAQTQQRSLLELGYFAHHVYNLKKSANEKGDYNKYYEEVKKLSDEQLRTMICK